MQKILCLYLWYTKNVTTRLLVTSKGYWTTFKFKKSLKFEENAAIPQQYLSPNFAFFFQYRAYNRAWTDITLSHILDYVQTRGAKILHTNSPWRINVVCGAKYLWHLKQNLPCVTLLAPGMLRWLLSFFFLNFVHPWLNLSSHLSKGLPCFRHKPNNILVKVNMSCMMCTYTTRQMETIIRNSQSLHLWLNRNFFLQKPTFHICVTNAWRYDNTWPKKQSWMQALLFYQQSPCLWLYLEGKLFG